MCKYPLLQPAGTWPATNQNVLGNCSVWTTTTLKLFIQSSPPSRSPVAFQVLFPSKASKSSFLIAFGTPRQRKQTHDALLHQFHFTTSPRHQNKFTLEELRHGTPDSNCDIMLQYRQLLQLGHPRDGPEVYSVILWTCHQCRFRAFSLACYASSEVRRPISLHRV